MSGVGGHHKEYPISNITIANNSFQNMMNTCINLDNFESFTVLNNTAKSVKRFTHCWGNSTGIFSRNNSTVDKKSNSTSMYIIENSTVECDREKVTSATANCFKIFNSTISIKKSTITNAQQHGIYVYGNCSVLSLKNSTISSCLANGVYLSGAKDCRASVSNNKILNNAKYGLIAKNSYVSATSNTVTQNKEADIRFYDSSIGQIQNNTLTSKKTLKYTKNKRLIVKNNKYKKKGS